MAASRRDPPMQIDAIREALREVGLKGWLFTDLHGQDPLARRILGLASESLASRRWFYWLPVEGEPVGLVHAIEGDALEELPGSRRSYAGWRALHGALREFLPSGGAVAMQYSPRAALPAISLVDAGTVELIRSFGVEIVSSADLVARFEALLDARAFESHRRAGTLVQEIKDGAFARIGEFLRQGKALSEYELQQWIMERFDAAGLVTNHAPVVAIDEHGADPHYSPRRGGTRRHFAPGQAVLIDLWAREKLAGGIYYDITWCAWTGPDPDPNYAELFDWACRARDGALKLVRERFEAGLPLPGWEVDAEARRILDQGGHGAFFVHRTGHSIGHEVHGAGVNMDDFETHDERLLVPGCCFSIEPGIYRPGSWGVRTEIDVCLPEAGKVEVFGAIQDSLLLIDC